MAEAGVIKFRLDPAPTFKTKVPIPVPGQEPDLVEFTFRHRMRDDFLQLMKEAPKWKDNVKAVMEVATGWELEEPFDAANIRRLDQSYAGAAKAVFDTYAAEMSGFGRGNA